MFGDLVQVLEKEYEGKVHVKIYRAGKDFDYIPKYGAVTKSVLEFLVASGEEHAGDQ